MSGTLLPSATKASPTVDYYLKNGDSPSFPVITTDELIVNSVGAGNAVLVQSATGDANMTIQGDLEANLNLDGPITHLILQAQDNTAASEIIVRSAAFGSGSNVNEVIISPNDTLYGDPTNLIQQNAHKPGGVILRQSLAKEDGSDNCFTSLTTDFQGALSNLATTTLAVLDSNAMEVQSLRLQPTGAAISGPLEVQVGGITIGGVPVAKSSLVPFINVVGSTITVPIGTSDITGNFAVIANHTYRVSFNARPISGDTNPGNYVSFITGLGYNFAGMGGISSGPDFDFPGGRAFSGIFLALSSGNANVQCINNTIASVNIELYPTGAPPPYDINPGVLVEDLGIL